MRDQLLDHIDLGRNKIIQWQQAMTALPAIGPENNGQGEHRKAAWIADELARIGMSEVAFHNCPDARVPSGQRPNISARVPGLSPRTLWIVGHMDVVPAGNLDFWRTSPFELHVKDDLLFGRGVEDNQQAIATAMLSAEALIAHNAQPCISLGLLCVADEETGMSHGLPHVLETAPELFRPDDLFLVPDMGNKNGTLLEIAEKSCLWLRITVTGKQCHASTPDKGINSLIAASACVLEMERLYREYHHKDPLYSPSWSTFVPSKKEANVENINTLPGRDVFYLDCRVLPEYDIVNVWKSVQAIAQEVAKRYRATIDVEIAHQEQAQPATRADAPVVLALRKALREVRGVDTRAVGLGGQTVAACLRRKGLSAAVWATIIGSAHAPNECALISAHIADAKIVISMLFDESLYEPT